MPIDIKYDGTIVKDVLEIDIATGNVKLKLDGVADPLELQLSGEATILLTMILQRFIPRPPGLGPPP